MGTEGTSPELGSKMYPPVPIVPTPVTDTNAVLRFGVCTRGAKEPSGSPDHPGEGDLWQVMLEHAQTCPQSILSMLFVMGLERCDIWLPD